MVAIVVLLVCLFTHPSHADKMIFKSGETVYGKIRSERDSVVRYLDRYDRPRQISAGEVDTILYDINKLRGDAKAAFRKGQPTDRTGKFRLRNRDDFDIKADYRTDSLSELDVHFRNGIHARFTPGAHFRVLKAPSSDRDPVVIRLDSGQVLIWGRQEKALAQIKTNAGVGVARGYSSLVVTTAPKDSSMRTVCLQGLCGIQQSLASPGELVVETGRLVRLSASRGVFESGPAPPEEMQGWEPVMADMERYRLEEIEYPPVNYWAKAVTGFGFMLFFYGSTLGVLGYVNNI